MQRTFYILVLFLAIFVGISFYNYTKVKLMPFESVNENALKTPASTNTDRDFTSQDLGIKFSYPIYTDKVYKWPIDVKQNGRKLELVITPPKDRGSKTVAQWIEIFEKDENETLEEAINRTALKGYSPLSCKIEPQSIDAFEGIFEVVSIKVPIHPMDLTSPGTYNWHVEQCPTIYTSFESTKLFIYDTTHPDKFAFIFVGQQLGPVLEDGSIWWYTLEFLD